MKKLLLIVTALFSCSLVEAYSTIYNPFTGKLDYVGISSASLPSGSTFYIQNTTSPQSATLNVTSGTITNFNATTINGAAPGDISAVTAGYGMVGGGLSGAVTLDWVNTSIASMTVTVATATTLSAPTINNVTTINGVTPGDITAVTAGFGLSGGATVGAATLNWTNIGIASTTVTVSTITTLTAPSIDGVTTINGVAPGDITAVTAGYGMTGGATVGAATLNWTNTSIASMTVTASTVTTLNSTNITVTTLTPTGIVGTASANNANPGNVGQYLSSAFQIIASTATGTIGDYTSIVLTAGDWDVTGCVNVEPNGATITGLQFFMTTTAGASFAGAVEGDNYVYITPMTAAVQGGGICIANWRLSTAGATVYFKMDNTFTIATPNVFGRISARRVR